MAGELITVKYAGPTTFQVGPLPCYDVRAWWVVRNESSIGRVKLAAGSELKRHVKADHVEFVCMDLDTYNSPHMNAMLTYRVLTKEQFERREARRKAVYRTCEECGDTSPGQLVRMDATQEERALCFTCWNPIKHTCQVIHWISANGKLQV
jgi:hypothetical protein